MKYLGFQPTDNQPYYFISYNNDKEDIERVSKICIELDEREVHIWYDYGIPYDNDWENVIAERICNCEAFIFFYTNKILEKSNSFVRQEYEYAKMMKKPIYIILLDEIDIKNVPAQYLMFVSEIQRHESIMAYQTNTSVVANILANRIYNSTNFSYKSKYHPKDFGFEPVMNGTHYFVAYNSDDFDDVAKISSMLDEKGMPLWYDRGIRYESDRKNWRITIERMLKSSEAMLLFYSNSILEKDASKDEGCYVLDEFDTAKEAGIDVYIIMLEDFDKNLANKLDRIFVINDFRKKDIIDTGNTFSETCEKIFDYIHPKFKDTLGELDCKDFYDAEGVDFVNRLSSLHFRYSKDTDIGELFALSLLRLNTVASSDAAQYQIEDRLKELINKFNENKIICSTYERFLTSTLKKDAK